MGKAKDLAGQKFGRLTVIEATKERKQGVIVWKCKCDCGNTIIVSIQKLNKGDTKSCGCLRDEYYESRLNENIRKYQIEGTNVAYLKSKKT